MHSFKSLLSVVKSSNMNSLICDFIDVLYVQSFHHFQTLTNHYVDDFNIAKCNYYYLLVSQSRLENIRGCNH